MTNTPAVKTHTHAHTLYRDISEADVFISDHLHPHMKHASFIKPLLMQRNVRGRDLIQELLAEVSHELISSISCLSISESGHYRRR